MPESTLLGLPSGTPRINEETCRGCGLCAAVCPAAALVVEDKTVRAASDPPFGCIGCGHCMAICPTGSITVSGRGIDPEDRIDLPPENTRATADQIEALLLARRSTRFFKEGEVPDETLKRVIDMAATAPMGIPPSGVGVIVFHGREKVQALAEDLVADFKGASRFLRGFSFLARPFLRKETLEALKSFVIPLLDLTREKRAEGRDVLLWDAPAAILFHYGPYADPADCDIAATYALIAATSLGLGACPIGTVKPVLDRNKALKEKYGIPRKNKCGLVVVMGHPRYRFVRSIRRRFASVAYA
ncbi:MAG: 4Fe-4S dicluster domain-containing protein [Planctomycetes bacterium]|nr:4Fe-4S dicluster domain-containing protein [Planctomycetota bacterium]